MNRLMCVGEILNISNLMYYILQCEYNNVYLQENRMPLLMAH